MTTQSFMVMSFEQSEEIRLASAERDYILVPRQVEAGVYADLFALPTRLKTDDRYAEFWPMLALLDVVEFDPVIAWPPIPDDEEEA